MNLSRRLLVMFLFVAAAVVTLNARPQMPVRGVWEVVTLYFNTAVGSGFQAANLTLSGTTVKASAGLEATTTVAAGTAVTAGTKVTAGTLLGGGGCPDLASAATLEPTEYCHYVTGSTGITNIATGTFTDGDLLMLVLGGSINITEGNGLTMAGNVTGGAEDSITFVYLNTKFVELARVNN